MSTAILGRALTLGLLSVDDTVGKYFPDLGDEAHRAITVRQLLNHTQGTHMQWSREFQGAFNPDRVKEFMSLPFDHEPGTYFEYSQTGPGVLNAIVEKAVGRDFQEFAQDEFFSKIGIPRANWFWFRDAHGWTEGPVLERNGVTDETLTDLFGRACADIAAGVPIGDVFVKYQGEIAGRAAGDEREALAGAFAYAWGAGIGVFCPEQRS